LLLFITLPDLARFDAATTARWTLCDANGNVIRSEETNLAGARAATPIGASIIALVPAGRVVFIETLLPTVSNAKRDQLVRYAIEDKLTIDPATVHAVVLDTGDAAKAGKYKGLHIAAAIDRTWFSAALDWLIAAQLPPRTAFAETALLPVKKGEWSVKLAAKNAYAKRADGFAYAIDAGSITQPPFALALAINEVAEKPSAISLFVDAAAANSEADRAALVANWQASLNVPVRIASTTSASPLTANPFKQLGALKSGNLVTGEFAPAHVASTWLKNLKPAIALIGLITAVQIAFVVIDHWQLERQRIRIEAEMRSTFQAAFPQATTIIDPALQMQRNLETLQLERGNSRGVWRSDDARRALARFAMLREALPNIEIVAVNIKKNDAKLTAKFDEKNGVTVSDVKKEIAARVPSMPSVVVAPGSLAGTIEIAYTLNPAINPANPKVTP
jgi:type II secretion system protein L